MTFDEALKHLGIEEFKDRILLSNSHGEMFHLGDYIRIAHLVEDAEEISVVRILFKCCVAFAEEHWKRPESCFQHMPQLIDGMVKSLSSETSKPACV